VRIGAQGAFFGTIRAIIVAVEGKITGDVHADKAIRLAATARVHGDLYAPRIAVARGAQVRGQISTNRGPDPVTAPDEIAVSQLLTGEG
jgi:cytoskeletal protein CcmA (bactofilin family)